LREATEEALLGGYRLIYPCYSNEEKMNQYKKMLDVSKQIHDYLTSGKKIKDGKTLRA